ncbi:copper chaperone PCu(A)C [Streptomyces samsunensis]|uniref:copper chaperone PCu(A)C n=1 Tax=Streptomyces TaxID=1883 RepID=UPI000C9C1C09|nr:MULTISPECIES: copper chaperone PCu(A)C [Streptomyces]MCD9586446.1 copper chaperone PCu(A)C [Streptomyces sp. 8ZJF_21]MCM3804296.1 copper chaperone PCu(A)C [Streptomyces sp. DR7-3]NUH36930.1 copper chaperone PCu(A)C [Streptomyces samsunensis]WHX23481.1 copper chaperone PCu(A)C [Streptomyces sp. NA07423]
MSSATDDRTTPRRRLRRTTARGVRAALVPVGGCALALALLTGYTATGAAGEPTPRIRVSGGRVVQSTGQTAAAYFEIRNVGDTDDTLIFADSPELGVSMLREPDRKRPGTVRRPKAVTVRAHSTLRMSREGIHVALLDPPTLRPGQRVSFNLWFSVRGRVGAEAMRSHLTDR